MKSEVSNLMEVTEASEMVWTFTVQWELVQCSKLNLLFRSETKENGEDAELG